METGITVPGIGTASGQPDRAVLALALEALDTDATQAITAVAQRMAALEGVVPAGDLHTTGFSVQPETEWRDSTSVFLGYRVRQALALQTTPEDVGRMIDGAVATQALVEGITFEVADSRELQKQARAAALADARTRAEQLAVDSGFRLGAVIAVEEQPGGPILFRTQSRDTHVAPGPSQVTVNLTVRFDLRV